MAFSDAVNLATLIIVCATTALVGIGLRGTTKDLRAQQKQIDILADIVFNRKP